MALDVRASVEEIKSLVGHRLQNVYDIGPKFLLLKFGLGDQKTTVLIENGVRMHITKLNREKPRMPSQFTFKLRKHIKKWRLDHVRQLLDHDNVIMMMLRTQKEKDVTLSVKGTYPLEAEREQRTSAMFLQAADDHFQKLDPATSLNKALTSFDNLGPQLADHVLAMAGLASNSKVSQFSVPPSSDASPLRVPLLHAFALLEGDAFQPGGVLVSDVTTSSAAAAGAPEQPAGPPRYSDFAPLVLKHLESKKIELRDSFGEICDQYFLRSEMEKIEQHNDKKEIATVSSKERFLREHNRRLEKLQSEEELNIKRGSMLEANADSVQEVIDLMNMLLAMKLGWDKIRLLVKARQREGHPVAYMIHDVHLDKKKICCWP
ncbi:Hypothetical protein, putative [Bodo saltans]|uniref:Uncharacterized protein n=1 Tax=Bodo saltans TaxID=75058 RepID=A0A0S4KK12_BODSA|nr:Hypothetical protein, putative [Bodo saltans]|eukprot:CUI11041.1 Hypothetical protein, putative [Bodo saltans]